MTDSINAFTVILDKDYKDYDAQKIAEVIKMIRGVLEIRMNVVNCTEAMVESSRLKYEMFSKIKKIITEF